MDILRIYEVQLEKVREKFSDVVDSSIILRSESGEPLKLRLDMIDGSIVDVFYSVGGKYSYHWERGMIDGSVYRHDNAPHKKWKNIKTFPKHFHNSSEDKGGESYISDDPLLAIEEFLEFVRGKLIKGDQGISN